jgi:hypothetical protein
MQQSLFDLLGAQFGGRDLLAQRLHLVMGHLGQGLDGFPNSAQRPHGGMVPGTDRVLERLKVGGGQRRLFGRPGPGAEQQQIDVDRQRALQRQTFVGDARRRVDLQRELPEWIIELKQGRLLKLRALCSEHAKDAALTRLALLADLSPQGRGESRIGAMHF